MHQRCASYQLLFLCCVVAALARGGGAHEADPNFIHCSPLPPPPLANFSQLLNHSSPSSSTFHQRHQFYDLRPHSPGDAVLFYAGPENAANAYTMSCTALLQFAQQVNASGIIAAEHRFFGASWPDNVTKDNYRWVMSHLTLDNILADYAAIISSFTRQGGHYDSGRVIVFGGSYGGFLSAMMRIKHPDVVFAAVASASPVHLTGSGVDTGLWYDSVAEIFSQQDGQCARAVASVFADLKSALDAGNFSEVQQQLNLCALPSAPLVGEFMILAMHAAQVIAQFNYPFKAAAKIPYPFQSFCSAVSQSGPTLAVMQLLLDIGYNNSGTLRCFGPKQDQLQHSSLIPLQLRASLPSPVIRDISFEMSWYYITCTFFGLPIAAGATSQAFFSFSYPYDLPAINNYCQTSLFWSGVTLQTVPPISEAMILKSSRIIFSNQELDPVAPFSISRSLSDTLLLFTVTNASHTQDIIAYDEQVAARAVSPSMPFSLLQLPLCVSRHVAYRSKCR
jgi:pimeloyl-ACP methyl ester carboxylesterase